jgi:protein SCO1/2
MLASPSMQRVLVLVLVTLLAATGVVLLVGRNSGETQTVANTHTTFDGPTMPPHLVAKNFSLTDQHAHRVTMSSYHGRVVILTFIHSLCKDDCPVMVEQIKGALNDMPSSGKGIPAIGVSVAPKEDTVSNRRKFLTLHGMNARIAFVNGPAATMRQIWRNYAIAAGTGPQGHSAVVILVDKRGVERVGFGVANLTPEGLAHDLRVLEAEPA